MYEIKKIKTAIEMVYNEPKILLNPLQDLYSGFQQMSFKKTKEGLQSSNFKTGTAGWNMTNTGNVEFNTGTFRGALEANSINIPDTTSTNSFHVDNTGNAWWGATTIGNSVAKILNTGIATFANINITGGTGVANLSDAGALATLNTVGTAQIDALAVTATEVASSAITTAKIASGAVAQAKIATGAVGSNQLSAGAVIAGKITAGTIVAGDIATGTITSNKIAANTIVAGNIAAGTITATNMNITNLSAITANLGTITAGNITGITITGSTIETATSGQRIVLDGSGTNNSLVMYDANGNNVVQFLGSYTTVYGEINIASDITGLIIQNISTVVMTNRMFQIGVQNVSSTGDTAYISNSGSGTALNIIASGNGKGIYVVNNGASSSPNIVVDIENFGNNNALRINNTNPVGNNSAIFITQTGLGRIAEIDQNNSSNPNSVIYISNQGSGLMMEMIGNSTIKSRGLAVTVNRSDAVNTTGGALLVEQLGTSSIIDTNVTGCYLSKAGVWTDASSKKLKENFKIVKVLDKLKKLDILEYNYISENINTVEKAKKHLKGKIKKQDNEKEVRELLKVTKNRPIPKHITPMAEDFHKIFGLGDKDGISPNDTAGVALQAIKELNKKVDELEKKLNNVII